MRKRTGFSGNAAPIGVRWLLKAMPWPCTFENILSGIDITICHIATERTNMGTDRQTLLHDLSALVTLLASETGTHSNHLMTSSCSLIFKNVEKCTPTGVHDGFRQLMVLDHRSDLKVFNRNVMIAFSIGLSCLEMVISSLPIDLQVRLSDVTGRFPASVTAFLASAHHALFSPQSTLRGAIKARIGNATSFTVSQEGLQPYIHADVRMRTLNGSMFAIWFRLTDDEGVPMPVSTQDKVNRLWSTLDRAMQLHLEEMPKLLGDNQMFLVLMQIAIFVVLPELDGMPPIRLLETREADTKDVVLLGSKKAFERLTEPISKRLHRGSGYVLTLPFECRLKIILAWECPVLLILPLDRLKHPIVNDARLYQASHELAGLLLIHEQAVLKCPHEHVLPQAIRNVKRQGNTHPCPK